MSVIAMMHGDADRMMSAGVGGWMVLWGLLAVSLLVLAVVATIWLLKHLSSSSSSSSSSGSEHQRLLERRYAAGEIDREEFLQRRDDLARRR